MAALRQGLGAKFGIFRRLTGNLRRRRGNPNAREFPGDLSFGPVFIQQLEPVRVLLPFGSLLLSTGERSLTASRDIARCSGGSALSRICSIFSPSAGAVPKTRRAKASGAPRGRELCAVASSCRCCPQRLVAPRLSFNRIFSPRGYSCSNSWRMRANIALPAKPCIISMGMDLSQAIRKSSTRQ